MSGSSQPTLEREERLRLAASDARLVEEIRQGSRSAYGELVQRYEKKLIRTIFRMVGNVQTAEDLAQETFLKAYDRLDRFDSSKRFSPWLFQIGVNTSIDWMRRNRKVHQYSLQEMTRGEGTYEISQDDPRPGMELRQEVQHVLGQIPMQYRTVLMLRDLEGFPCSEVADIVGRKEPTIRWRLLKAREMFRELWERREQDRADEGD